MEKMPFFTSLNNLIFVEFLWKKLLLLNVRIVNVLIALLKLMYCYFNYSFLLTVEMHNLSIIY